MLQIVCSDTWADKDRCCEIPALVGGKKALATVMGPVRVPLRHCDTESGVDGLPRSTMLREMKADFLTEVSRGLNSPTGIWGKAKKLHL